MSKQGFGGDDDKDKSDIERLLDGLTSAKGWYEKNKDIFERFKGAPNNVDLAGGEPISEAHVNEDKVLIVADVSGVNATNLELSFYNGKVDGKLGEREFTVDVPNDVDEDSIEADMKNGVLRVELDREGVEGDDISVETVDHTEDEDVEGDSGPKPEMPDDTGTVDLEEVFDEDWEPEDDDEGGED